MNVNETPIRWKQVIIKGKLSPYIVSDNGLVMSLQNPDKAKLLKSYPDKDGYRKVSLSYKKKTVRHFMVHRLVAMAFCPGQTKERNIVNHKDGVKWNNNASNLEWVTLQENEDHASLHFLKANGERNSLCTYPDEIIRKVCKLIILGYTNMDISKMLSLTYNIPWQIRHGKIRHQIIDDFIDEKYSSLEFNDYRNWTNYAIPYAVVRE